MLWGLPDFVETPKPSLSCDERALALKTPFNDARPLLVLSLGTTS